MDTTQVAAWVNFRRKIRLRFFATAASGAPVDVEACPVRRRAPVAAPPRLETRQVTHGLMGPGRASMEACARPHGTAI